MSNNGIVIDLGKGTISETGVSECKRKGIEMWRVDITPMLDSIVSASFSMNNLIKNIYGKKDLEIGIRIVSGGYIGDKYDVVVDNFNIPKVIIGVCDSRGKFMEKFDEKSKNIINSINDYIKSLS